MQPAPETFDVLIVGAGPTGLTLANLLGGMGVSVLLVERNLGTVEEPRAVSIDDESMRTMQAAGLADKVLAITARGYGSIYKGPNKKPFAQVMPFTREYGWDKRNAFEQPALEAILREGLSRYPNVRAMFGHEVSSFEQQEDFVDVSIEAGGTVEIVRARYMAGCDGGRSPTRKTLGVTLEGSSFEEPWLIVDLWQTKNRCRHTEVLCDPALPFITLPGPNGIRRYEFMLRADDDKTEAAREDNVRALLARVGPDGDMPLRRIQVYTFHARLAGRWRDRRVFLAGDAAHLTPPFAGQGMNSGLRDAHNLAWKLHEAIRAETRDGATQHLLDSYEIERKPHAWQMIRLALTMGGVMMPKSRLRAWFTRLGFRALGLWPPAKAYVVQMRYKPKPKFDKGLIWTLSGDLASEVVGQMIPQPELETLQGRRKRMDDLLPDRPVVMIIDSEPECRIEAADLQALREAGAEVVGIVPEGRNPIEAPFQIYRDSAGLFSAEPHSNCMGHAILLRRDRYIAAVVPLDDLRSLAANVRDLSPAAEAARPLFAAEAA